MDRLEQFINYTTVYLKLTIAIFFLIIIFSPIATKALAFEEISGEQLFLQHCSGCHVNGGNIVKRGKTLKIGALKRNELDNPEAIARVARLGIGIMDGYEEVLGENGDKKVADWVWEQAQNAWIQG